MPDPSDMPARTRPLGRAEELRLRARAASRLRKVLKQLPDRDADQLLALHERLDAWYVDLSHLRAETGVDDEPAPPRKAVTG